MINKSTKLVILLTFIFQSQQILACNFISLDKSKWTYNPLVVFDVELQGTGLAEEAIANINAELKDIQLEYEYSNEDFVTLSTFMANGGTVEEYNDYYTNLINTSTGKILVIVDEGASGFGGIYSQDLGIVRLKTSDFEELEEARINVLMHELLHALSIRHIPPAWERRNKKGFLTKLSLETLPVMNKFVLRSRIGFNAQDKHAIHRTYGVPCHKNHVKIHMEDSQVLNVALIPVKRNNINDKAVTASFLDGTADLFVDDGRYIIAVRSLRLTGQIYDYEADSGEPQFQGVRYLRGRRLIKNIKRASRVRILGNKEIQL